MDYTEHLNQLRAQAWFQSMLKEKLLPQCPDVPAYSPGKQIDYWQYGSGLRAGYLLALRHLGVEID